MLNLNPLTVCVCVCVCVYVCVCVVCVCVYVGEGGGAMLHLNPLTGHWETIENYCNSTSSRKLPPAPDLLSSPRGGSELGGVPKPTQSVKKPEVSHGAFGWCSDLTAALKHAAQCLQLSLSMPELKLA